MLDCKLERLQLIDCKSLLKVPEGLHHLTSLQELHINHCPSLVSIPDVGLPPFLKRITIDGCRSLLHFAKYQNLPTLRSIKISECENLRSLIEKEEVVEDGSCVSAYCLEYLQLRLCPSMVLLWKGKLPRALTHLQIRNCTELELIADRFLDDSCQLESIGISDCPNLKFLPEGLCQLTKLQSLCIRDCQSLVSLPRMSVWPRNMSIVSCEKLEVSQLVMRDMMQTSDLEELTSLRELYLWGERDQSIVSFPPGEREKEMMLPTSLVKLDIRYFRNLKKLNKGFQFLTSLETLYIFGCPKLTTIPEEEGGLPASFTYSSCY
ncbi:hypothetical protein ACLB2K_075040 [Fragaria x ananassa]